MTHLRQGDETRHAAELRERSNKLSAKEQHRQEVKRLNQRWAEPSAGALRAVTLHTLTERLRQVEELADLFDAFAEYLEDNGHGGAAADVREAGRLTEPQHWRVDPLKRVGSDGYEKGHADGREEGYRDGYRDAEYALQTEGEG